MALYTIGDTHLSLGSAKPMDVFGGAWTGYVEKLTRGLSVLREEDTLVIAGDISWGMSLEESEADFAWLNALPGRKILMKGNHDYWWNTAAKMNRFFQENPQITCGITFNSKVYIVGEYLIGHNMKNFKLIGYDLLRRNVSCLKEGAVDFLIAQQPTAQGYSGVESLCNHLIFKKEVKQCNYMPITLLAVENVDFYLDAHKK